MSKIKLSNLDDNQLSVMSNEEMTQITGGGFVETMVFGTTAKFVYEHWRDNLGETIESIGEIPQNIEDLTSGDD